MRTIFVQIVTVALFAALTTGCVTTTTSRFDDKRDLAKAEKTYIQIGYGYFEQGELQDSKRALIQALDINPKSAGAHLGLARVYERELEFKLADSHFRKAIRYEDSTENHFQYGVYLYNRGDLKGAYDEFKTVLKDTVYARRAQASQFQGVVATELDKLDVAIVSYERAIALNPMMADSYIGLARIYREQGNLTKAYERYNGFIKLVRAQVARHNSQTLWLGIQLADQVQDLNALASLELQLRNQFSTSPEYKLYQEWKASKDAA